MIKTLGIGDNVCDKYLHISTAYPGGNALNVAVFSKMFGAEGAYLGTFGDDVIDHYVHQARIEVEAFDAAVTDWERVRGFERL